MKITEVTGPRTLLMELSEEDARRLYTLVGHIGGGKEGLSITPTPIIANSEGWSRTAAEVRSVGDAIYEALENLLPFSEKG